MNYVTPQDYPHFEMRQKFKTKLKKLKCLTYTFNIGVIMPSCYFKHLVYTLSNKLLIFVQIIISFYKAGSTTPSELAKFKGSH